MASVACRVVGTSVGGWRGGVQYVWLVFACGQAKLAPLENARKMCEGEGRAPHLCLGRVPDDVLRLVSNQLAA